MAKEWAKPFYRSTTWTYLRRWVLRRDGYTCEYCGGRAEEVHHEIELTKENINNPHIALNPELLHSLCHVCHTRVTQKAEDCNIGFYFTPDGQLERKPPRGESGNSPTLGTEEGLGLKLTGKFA